MRAGKSIRTILATVTLLTAGTGLANGSVERLDPGSGPTVARGTGTLHATGRSPSRGEQYVTEFDDAAGRRGANASHRSTSGLAADDEMRLEKLRAVLHRIEIARRHGTMARGDRE